MYSVQLQTFEDLASAATTNNLKISVSYHNPHLFLADVTFPARVSGRLVHYSHSGMQRRLA